MRQGIAVLSIAYIPQLATVYVGMADGSIKAYNDTINAIFNDEEYCIEVVTSLEPIMTYQDINQASVTLLPVVVTTTNAETDYHLWVGQRNRGITVLNAKNLSIIDFVISEQDNTSTPRCLSNLSFAYLTCSDGNLDDISDGSDCLVVPESVLVYGALQHGQYISCWDAVSREIVTCVDCKELLPKCKNDIILLNYNYLFITQITIIY